MKLLGDKIAVRLEEQPDMTEGGLVLPEGAKEKPVRGEIVEIGPEVKMSQHPDPRLSKGDQVIFSKYAGITVEIEDDEFLILRENDILVIL